jgi:hypothetical protein
MRAYVPRACGRAGGGRAGGRAGQSFYRPSQIRSTGNEKTGAASIDNRQSAGTYVWRRNGAEKRKEKRGEEGEEGEGKRKLAIAPMGKVSAGAYLYTNL